MHYIVCFLLGLFRLCIGLGAVVTILLIVAILTKDAPFQWMYKPICTKIAWVIASLVIIAIITFLGCLPS